MVLRQATFWTVAGSAFVFGLLLGISGVPMAFLAKHVKNPPIFSII